MPGTTTTPNDQFAAVASFFVPGLGQLIAGEGARGVLWMVGTLAVWWLPNVVVGLHLAVLGSGDPLMDAGAYDSMSPLAWALRFLFHMGSGVDASGARQRQLASFSRRRIEVRIPRRSPPTRRP